MALYPRNYFEPLAGGLDHPEGVTYGPDGFVYAGGEAGQVYRLSSCSRLRCGRLSKA